MSFSSPACSSQKTKEVGARVIVGGQGAAAQGKPPCRAAEQGGQRRHGHADGEEDRREDGDAAERVRGHHYYRGVHRSGQ